MIDDISAQIKEREEKRSETLWNRVSLAQVLGCTVHSSFQRKELSFFCNTKKLAIVYDEAGMVGRYALIPMLALVKGESSPCGQIKTPPQQVAFVFSGDPKQLSPIANIQEKDVNARCWLSDSLMEKLPATTVMLNEQSRMEPEICQVISNSYYDSQLKTLPDPDRLAIPLVPDWPRAGIFLVDPQKSIYLALSAKERCQDLSTTSTWNERSVRLGALLIQWALDKAKIRKILWLTPFREQTQRLRQVTNLLFQTLEPEENTVDAGTVHSAQGSEADLVIFDPVKPGHPWFKDERLTDRLLNVAISRGRTQVIILASRNQLRRVNPFWKTLHTCKQYTIQGTAQEPVFYLDK